MKRFILSLFAGALAIGQAAYAQPKTPKVCYEIFVRSFADSNGDGLGDLNGITAKLDYLKNLGVDALWLTPISKSPTYHKYDVVDYKSIDPEYGTLDDYKRLIQEAHKRGILVFKDFVINHSSSEHPWFVSAKGSKTSPYRNYYNWLPPKTIDSLGIATREAAGGSWELTPWHFANKGDDEKYYGLFTGMMPDLNYDNPKLRREIYEIGKWWLQDIGVDGFRLDAAKHIYPDWEAPKSHAFWQEFYKEMASVKPEVYLIGEVWTTPDKVAPYFKGLPANFNIDAHLKLHEILKTGNERGFIKKLISDYKTYAAANPNFIDAPILSNHDGTRIGTVVGGDINKMKAAANLLLTLPGEPYLYYGEEIGMLGEKPDEFLREPFLWTAQATDKSRPTWEKPRFSNDQTVRPLSVQEADPNSLYNHYKKLIAFRKSQPALVQVTPVNLAESGIDQEGVLSFIRPHQKGNLVIIQNLTGEMKTIPFSSTTKSYKKVLFRTNSANVVKDALQLGAYGMAVLTK